MKEINEDNFLEEVLESDIPVVVDLFTSWCMPCRRMGDMLDQLSQKYQGKAKFYKLDIDKNRELADKLNIGSVPTLLFFGRDGEIEAQVGLVSEEKVKSKIEKVLVRR
ncbi:unnamed protein product [marine sediment metagenome]|uniref:Thioredoxin domain-containing protein n=1 Tax=marine sediment metagenome TaxID=412755 RepID=X1FLK9_9ZZZZ